ncbi:hypothetical protein AB0M12_41720 [Nocardia vinacea]|uniref:hypothetical protein n=1 Tax=Nocardia vinacea TaxID=96468 RepID=UPI0034491C90
MSDPMNREAEQAMRAAFGAWMRLREAILRGDNEVEREQLILKAEELTDQWEASPWGEEWQYLTALVAGWRRDPATMRAVTAAAQAGGMGLTEVEVRSLTQVWLLLDPAEAGRAGWQHMHDRLSAFHGRLAAVPHELDTAGVEAQLEAIYDRSTWPAEWHQFEHDVLTDQAFWTHQESVFDLAYQQALTGLVNQ